MAKKGTKPKPISLNTEFLPEEKDASVPQSQKPWSHTEYTAFLHALNDSKDGRDLVILYDPTKAAGYFNSIKQHKEQHDKILFGLLISAIKKGRSDILNDHANRLNPSKITELVLLVFKAAKEVYLTHGKSPRLFAYDATIPIALLNLEFPLSVEQGQALLETATQIGNEALVDLLLAKNVPITSGHLAIAAMNPRKQALVKKFLAKNPRCVNSNCTIDIELPYYELKQHVERDIGPAVYVAALSGSTEIIQSFIGAGAVLQVVSQLKGNHLLHATAIKGDEKLNGSLIQEHKLDPNARNHDKETPSHVAARYQNFSAIRAFLEAKADVTLRDKWGNTVLHSLIQTRRIGKAANNHADFHRCVNSLLTAGIEVNAVNMHGDTVLHDMAMSFDLDISTLLEHKPDVNAQNKDGQTPLMLAINAHNWDAVFTLISHPDIKLDLVDHKGMTALHHAAKLSESTEPPHHKEIEKVVQCLIKAAADCSLRIGPHTVGTFSDDVIQQNARIFSAVTCIRARREQQQAINEEVAAQRKLSELRAQIAAVTAENVEDEKRLQQLQRDLTITPRDEIKSHPAVEAKNESLKLHTSKVHSDNSNNHDLYVAAFKGDIKEFERLLPTSKKSYLYEALQFAACSRSKPMVERVLKLDAVKETIHRDNMGLSFTIGRMKIPDSGTAVFIAACHGSIDIIQLLVSHGAKLVLRSNTEQNTLVHIAALNNDVALLRYLAEQKLDFNTVNIHGETPLVHAMKHGSWAAITTILTLFPAMKEAVDKNGNLPLHHLLKTTTGPCDQGFIECFNLMFESIRDLNAKNNDGSTLLMLAVQMPDTLALKLLLEKSGIHIDATDPAGHTALHHAARLGHLQHVELLLAAGANCTLRTGPTADAMGTNVVVQALIRKAHHQQIAPPDAKRTDELAAAVAAPAAVSADAVGLAGTAAPVETAEPAAAAAVHLETKARAPAAAVAIHRKETAVAPRVIPLVAELATPIPAGEAKLAEVALVAETKTHDLFDAPVSDAFSELFRRDIPPAATLDPDEDSFLQPMVEALLSHEGSEVGLKTSDTETFHLNTHEPLARYDSFRATREHFAATHRGILSPTPEAEEAAREKEALTRLQLQKQLKQLRYKRLIQQLEIARLAHLIVDDILAEKKPIAALAHIPFSDIVCEAEDKRAGTLLEKAIQKNHGELIDHLLTQNYIVTQKHLIGLYRRRPIPHEDIILRLLGCTKNLPSPQQLLFFAYENNHQRVIAEITKRTNLTLRDAKDEHGRTALHCWTGVAADEKTIKAHHALTPELLAHLNTQDTMGFTALMEAIIRNNAGTTKRLLDEKPDVTLQGPDNNTALHYLVKSRLNDVRIEREINQFAALNADINAVNAQGESPLIIAARKNNRHAMKALLGCGAHTDIQDKNGKTALDYCPDLIKLLPTEKPWERQDFLNAVQLATMGAYLAHYDAKIDSFLKMLRPMEVNSALEQALLIAVNGQKVDTVKYLTGLVTRHLGMDTAPLNKPLTKAGELLFDARSHNTVAVNPYLEIIAHFLQSNVTLVQPELDRLLNQLAYVGAGDLVERVLQEGAVITADTLVCVLSRPLDSHTTLAKKLLQRNPGIINTPPETFCMVGEGEDSGPPLYIAAAAGNRDAIDFLLTAGARIQFVSRPRGNRILHAIARHGDQALCQRLMHDYPLDAKQTNYREETPLHVAARYQNVDAIKAFALLPGINALTNIFGRTALHSLLVTADNPVDERFIQCLQQLIQSDIPIDATDGAGMTALHYAAMLPNGKKAVELLIAAGANCSMRSNFQREQQGMPRTVKDLATRLHVKKLISTYYDAQRARDQREFKEDAVHDLAKLQQRVADLIATRGEEESKLEVNMGRLADAKQNVETLRTLRMTARASDILDDLSTPQTTQQAAAPRPAVVAAPAAQTVARFSMFRETKARNPSRYYTDEIRALEAGIDDVSEQQAHTKLENAAALNDDTLVEKYLDAGADCCLCLGRTADLLSQDPEVQQMIRVARAQQQAEIKEPTASEPLQRLALRKQIRQLENQAIAREIRRKKLAEQLVRWEEQYAQLLVDRIIQGDGDAMLKLQGLLKDRSAKNLPIIPMNDHFEEKGPALERAVRANHSALVALLLQETDSKPSPDFFKLLYNYRPAIQEDIILQLLRSHDGIMLTNRFNEDLFFSALEAGHAEVVDWFLTKGVYIDLSVLDDKRMERYKSVDSRVFSLVAQHQGGPHDTTLLIDHIILGNTIMATHLLEAKTDVNKQDKYGQRALHYMAALACTGANGFQEQHLQKLLEAKAEIDAVNRQGETALIRAAKAGNVRATKFLLHSGADASIRDNKGMTAADHAATFDGESEMAALFQSAAAAGAGVARAAIA